MPCEFPLLGHKIANSLPEEKKMSRQIVNVRTCVNEKHDQVQ